jgi:hypothetical protein
LRNQDSCPNRTSTPFHSLDRSSGVSKFPIDLGERIDDVVRSGGQIGPATPIKAAVSGSLSLQRAEGAACAWLLCGNRNQVAHTGKHSSPCVERRLAAPKVDEFLHKGALEVRLYRRFEAHASSGGRPAEGVSPQKVDETKVALRELRLKNSLEGE